MTKYSIFKLIAVCSLGVISTGLNAQSKKCTINGTLTNVKLKNGKQIKKVYLNRLNGDGSISLVDSSLVQQKSFAFNRTVDEYPMVYTVSGFDNGNIKLFVEEGQVNLKADAAVPGNAMISGTTNNEVLSKYQVLNNSKFLILDNKQNDSKSATNKDQQIAIANSQYFVDLMRFIFANHSSPLAPLLMQTEIVPQIVPGNALQNISNWAHPAVKNHPYAENLKNVILGENLRVGGFTPSFTMNTFDAKTVSVKNLSGKFVFIDFWKNDAAFAKELPHLLSLNAKTKNDPNFALISVSMDVKKDVWKAGIEKNKLNNPGWIHASDLKGFASPAAKLFQVTATPRSVLIDPEGRVIALDLHGDEMVKSITKKLRTRAFVVAAEKVEDDKKEKAVQEMKNDKVMAFDFEQADVNGKMVKLSDFRGKYVFLDFWASWCAPCRMENPNLVKAYNKYKDKNFTILGVSLDKPGAKKEWLDAIKKDGLTWTQVSDLKGWDNVVVGLYGVASVPQSYLIDPDGAIIGMNLRGEALQKKLAELFDSDSGAGMRLGQ